MAPFEEAVVIAKVAKICDHVGYHAISRESASILVDLYIRTFIHLARHCKEFANNNRRVEPTLTDLVQAYDFIGISIPELKEHAETIKISLDLKIERDEEKPSNRIQRNLFVDDLLEAEKSNGDENDEGGENRAASEHGEESEKNMTPLLKDIYHDISKQFPDPQKPVMADKVRIKREEKPVIPKLKITPLDPSIAEPPSFLPILENSKQENLITNVPTLLPTPPPIPSTSGSSKIRTKKESAKRSAKGLRSKETTPKKQSKKDKKKLARSQPEAQPPKAPLIKQAKKDKSKPVQRPVDAIPTPETPQAKSAKKDKKKKRSSNEFAIEAEPVTEDKEWLCPTCNGPDNGDLMIGCDTCDLWYHLRCTNLKRAPKDEEKWSCIKCTTKIEELKQPSPSPSPSPHPKKVSVPTPPTPSPPTPESPQPAPVIAPIAPPVGSSQDDLCPECNLPDDGTLMIQCDDPCCARWFHGKCVSVLEEPKDDESWFCKGCVEKQQSAFKRRRRAK